MAAAETARTAVPAGAGPGAPPAADDGVGDASGAPVQRIRTEPEHHDEDWARTMGRFGARQGAERPGGRRARGRRVLAGLLGVVVLLGVLVGGGYFLLSRAYFVGEHEGMVAIHRGLPERVAGVPLFWVIENEISDIALDDLPTFRRTDVADGLSAGTLREARQVVAVLQQQVEEADEATPGPTDEPTAVPEPTADPSPAT